MEQDLFSNLPREIMIDILSRLPVRFTARCKCVRKSWRSLIETLDFVKSYKSFPGLAVFQGKESSKPYKVYKFEDEHDKNPWNEVFNFSLPHPDLIHSSANGLLLLLNHKSMPHKLVLCNPVTREFINLPNPQASSSPSQIQFGPFGFGVSKTTGQYKLVKIFHDYHESGPGHLKRDRGSHCQVYTLGTGSWRSIPSGLPLLYDIGSVGASLNGNFHCLAFDFMGCLWISCFDLETELFSTFAPPNLDSPSTRNCEDFMSLSVLKGCLGLCDNSAEHEIVIWLLNTYGDEESWTRQFVISTRNRRSDFYGVVYAIKVFENGNILIKKEVCAAVLCYSDKNKTIQGTDLIDSSIHGLFSAVCYTPSFLPLKSFPMENVSSF